MAETSKLYIWPMRSLYLGTTFVPLRDYTVGSDQLFVCLEGAFGVHLADGSVRYWRSALLRAGTKVPITKVETSSVVGGIIYLNPLGQDHAVLAQYMTDEVAEMEGTLYGHQNEDHIIERLRDIRDHGLPSNKAAAIIDDLVIPPVDKGRELVSFDPRILRVILRIKETVRDNLSVAELAEDVHLSESRLVKLFKSQIGIPITKFRLRYRVFVGVICLVKGYNITEAALAAGFASTAHFSKCFSAMLGIQPSSHFLKPPFLDVILADEIHAAVAQAQERRSQTQPQQPPLSQKPLS